MSDYQKKPFPQVIQFQPPGVARKGRGATSNMQGRFEVAQREEFDDGWAAEDELDEPAALRTIVTEEQAKSILSRNASPDLPFNVSLNPYRVITPEK